MAHQRRTGTAGPRDGTDRFPRVAYFSPLSPDPSGVSDYSEELLAHLVRHLEIDVFVDACRPTEEIRSRHRVIDVARVDPLPLLPAYDAVLYQIGNAASHAYAYRTLLRHPGLVVLHDLSLVHLILSLTHDRGRDDLLFAEMRAQHGDEAAELARRWRYCAGPAPWTVDPLRYTLNRQALEKAVRVLVHSEFAEAELRRAFPHLRLSRLDHHAYRPNDPGGAPRQIRDRGRIVFLTAGFLNPEKRVDLVLRALSLLQSRLEFEYRLVGNIWDEGSIRSLIRDLGLDQQVTICGRVGKADLYRHLADADVCVNLRHPYHGETSGMVMRALACGRPLVVNATGWFLELPDGCARKVPVIGDRDEEAHLLAGVLLELGSDARLRRSMASCARRYARGRDVASRALGYLEFIQRASGRSAAVQATARVTRELEHMGVRQFDQLSCGSRRSVRKVYGPG